MPLKRSISLCLLSRKLCSRSLSERQYITHALYNSFSFLTTVPKRHHHHHHHQRPWQTRCILHICWTESVVNRLFRERCLTLLHCGRGEQPAFFDILFSGVQRWGQKLLTLHVQHQLLCMAIGYPRGEKHKHYKLNLKNSVSGQSRHILMIGIGYIQHEPKPDPVLRQLSHVS